MVVDPADAESACIAALEATGALLDLDVDEPVGPGELSLGVPGRKRRIRFHITAVSRVEVVLEAVLSRTLTPHSPLGRAASASGA